MGIREQIENAKRKRPGVPGRETNTAERRMLTPVGSTQHQLQGSLANGQTALRAAQQNIEQPSVQPAVAPKLRETSKQQGLLASMGYNPQEQELLSNVGSSIAHGFKRLPQTLESIGEGFVDGVKQLPQTISGLRDQALGRQQPVGNEPFAGAGKQMVAQLENPSLRGGQTGQDTYRDKIRAFQAGEAPEFTNADVKGKFRGNTFDGKAVSKGFDDVLAVHAKYDKIASDRKHGRALDSLRERVARGGFGSNRAAASLKGLLDSDAAQTAAAGKGNASSLDLANFNLKQQEFADKQSQQGQQAFTEYFKTAYQGNEEEGARRFKLASGIQSAVTNVQSASEADRVLTLMDKFTDDTGAIGGRSPIEAFSQIASLKRSPNGEDLELTDVDGRVYSNAGPEWFGTKDLSTSEQEELIQLFEKKR